jgi:alpha-tubulin suppressor-like RCC1 family protein
MTVGPVQVKGLTEGVSAITTGGMHTCATVDGFVQCWGAGSHGQLGNQATFETSSPTEVRNLKGGVAALVAGNYYTCAVVDGTVQCWGSNFNCELGIDYQENGWGTVSPVKVTGL